MSDRYLERGEEMIRLDVEDYCNDCLDFEPEVVERPMHLETLDPYVTPVFVGDTIVKCTKCDLCKNLMNHLHRKFREEQ